MRNRPRSATAAGDLPEEFGVQHVASPGERNQVTLRGVGAAPAFPYPTAWEVSDKTAPLAAAAGCVTIGEQTANAPSLLS